MPRIVRSPTAQQDLDQIWDYIARDSVDAADRLLDRIQERCELVARQPLSGHAREELGLNVRCFVVGNYVVYYRPIRRSIEIVRVLHGARDISSLF